MVPGEAQIRAQPRQRPSGKKEEWGPASPGAQGQLCPGCKELGCVQSHCLRSVTVWFVGGQMALRWRADFQEKLLLTNTNLSSLICPFSFFLALSGHPVCSVRHEPKPCVTFSSIFPLLLPWLYKKFLQLQFSRLGVPGPCSSPGTGAGSAHLYTHYKQCFLPLTEIRKGHKRPHPSLKKKKN